MNRDRRIVIVGFMGCGKTSAAKHLARLLACSMVDLDSFITDREGRSPAEIIEHDGEDAFRKIETETLREVLADSSARVIALGGGAWTIEANRELVNRHDCVSVWLDTPFKLCWNRITSGNTNRPLAPDRSSAHRLYDSRRKSYEQAQLHVDINQHSKAHNTAATIIKKLEKVFEGT